jgi:hypothetical protein
MHAEAIARASHSARVRDRGIASHASAAAQSAIG